VLASAQAALVDLGDLIVAQFKLARLEVGAEVRRAGAHVIAVAVFAPVVAVGWGLVLAAVAGWMRDWLGLSGALLALGLVHLGAGALGLYVGLTRLARAQPLHRATRGVAETVDRVKQALAP
jgi:hypothetical protein